MSLRLPYWLQFLAVYSAPIQAPLLWGKFLLPPGLAGALPWPLVLSPALLWLVCAGLWLFVQLATWFYEGPVARWMFPPQDRRAADDHLMRADHAAPLPTPSRLRLRDAAALEE